MAGEMNGYISTTVVALASLKIKMTSLSPSYMRQEIVNHPCKR